MKMFNRIFLPLLLLLFFLFQLASPALAEEHWSVKKEIINPGSFYYSLKRLWERSLEMIQFSEKGRLAFYHSQLKTRFSELNYVVESKLLSEVQQSTERFAYTAGILTDELIKQANSSDKEKIIKEFENYSKSLEQLRDKYPANTSFWMLIQHDINTLNILSDKLK